MLQPVLPSVLLVVYVTDVPALATKPITLWVCEKAAPESTEPLAVMHRAFSIGFDAEPQKVPPRAEVSEVYRFGEGPRAQK